MKQPKRSSPTELVNNLLDLSASSCELPRRRLLQTAGLALSTAMLGLSSSAPVLAATDNGTSTMASAPTYEPTSEYVFSILATIDKAMTVGDTAKGQIRGIPITGGEVTGPGIKGRVLPGGADWQLTRPDGVTEIEATYAIELGGKTLVKVINRGLIAPPRKAGDAVYFRTTIHFDAPVGPYAWLNEAIFLCKAGLHPSQANTVLIEVFKLV